MKFLNMLADKSRVALMTIALLCTTAYPQQGHASWWGSDDDDIEDVDASDIIDKHEEFTDAISDRKKYSGHVKSLTKKVDRLKEEITRDKAKVKDSGDSLHESCSENCKNTSVCSQQFFGRLQTDIKKIQDSSQACITIYESSKFKDIDNSPGNDSDCVEAVKSCEVVKDLIELKEKETKLKSETALYEKKKDEVSDKKDELMDLVRDCPNCAVMAQQSLAMRSMPMAGSAFSMFNNPFSMYGGGGAAFGPTKPSGWDYALGFLQTVVPGALSGLGLYYQSKAVNKYWGGYNNYLQQCATVGVPCQQPMPVGVLGGAFGPGIGAYSGYAPGMFPGAYNVGGGFNLGFNGAMGLPSPINGGSFGMMPQLPMLPPMAMPYQNPYMGGFQAGAGAYFGAGTMPYPTPYFGGGLTGGAYMGGYPPGYMGGTYPGYGAGSMFGGGGLWGGLSPYSNPQYQAMMQASLNSQMLQSQRALESQQNMMYSQQALFEAQQNYYQTYLQSQMGQFGALGGSAYGPYGNQIGLGGKTF